MHDFKTPVGIVDVTSHEFSVDPGPGYDQLRAVAPISWQPAARGYLLTRFADIAQAYRDPTLIEHDLSNAWRKIGRNVGISFEASLQLFKYMPFIYEGRRHQELRTAMARAVAPFAAAHPIFERRVSQAVAAMRRDGAFDLVKQFSGTLMFDVLGDLIELPESEREEIRPLSNISWALDPTVSAKKREIAEATIARCMAPLTAHVRRTLAQPGSTLIHGINRSLPPDEPERITATANLLAVVLVMGNDAVAGCINFAVRRMLSGEHDPVPQAGWAAISDDAIRYAAPVSFSTRVTTKDTVIGGCPFSRGKVLVLAPFAANHDPAVSGPNPNQIMERPRLGTGLAFAAGAHICVGLRISRSIVKSAYKGLAQLPTLKLTGTGTPGEGRVVRTLKALPIEFQ